MNEHRSNARQRVFKAGKIEFGPAAIDCVIRNMSPTGAALQVESPIGIPDCFDLVIPQEHSRRSARIVWRKEKRIGIRFD